MGPLRTAALRCSAHYRGLCGSSSVDPKEVEKFASQAAKWWHPSGAAAPLHRMNPARVAYIRAAIERTIPIANSNMLSTDHAHPTKPLDGVKLVDVGCGGTYGTFV